MARICKEKCYLQELGTLKHIIIEGRDFKVARTRVWGECALDEKLLWLVFLPSLTRTSQYMLGQRSAKPQHSFKMNKGLKYINNCMFMVLRLSTSQ